MTSIDVCTACICNTGCWLALQHQPQRPNCDTSGKRFPLHCPSHDPARWSNRMVPSTGPRPASCEQLAALPSRAPNAGQQAQCAHRAKELSRVAVHVQPVGLATGSIPICFDNCNVVVIFGDTTCQGPLIRLVPAIAKAGHARRPHAR